MFLEKIFRGFLKYPLRYFPVFWHFSYDTSRIFLSSFINFRRILFFRFFFRIVYRKPFKGVSSDFRRNFSYNIFYNNFWNLSGSLSKHSVSNSKWFFFQKFYSWDFFKKISMDTFGSS